MKPTLYRQGDILFIQNELQTAPESATLHAELPIAEGEITGHHHVARGQNLSILFTRDQDIVDFLAPLGCRIEHDEHLPLELPPGSYQVRRQREYTYTEPQDVAD